MDPAKILELAKYQHCGKLAEQFKTSRSTISRFVNLGLEAKCVAENRPLIDIQLEHNKTRLDNKVIALKKYNRNIVEIKAKADEYERRTKELLEPAYGRRSEGVITNPLKNQKAADVVAHSLLPREVRDERFANATEDEQRLMWEQLEGFLNDSFAMDHKGVIMRVFYHPTATHLFCPVEWTAKDIVTYDQTKRLPFQTLPSLGATTTGGLFCLLGSDVVQTAITQQAIEGSFSFPVVVIAMRVRPAIERPSSRYNVVMSENLFREEGDEEKEPAQYPLQDVGKVLEDIYERQNTARGKCFMDWEGLQRFGLWPPRTLMQITLGKTGSEV